MLLCLLSLAGCSSSPPIVRNQVVTKTEYVLPPKELISQCRVPIPPKVLTNRDLHRYSLALLAALELCNLDWLTLSVWYQQQEQHHD
ncbi:Rz1-like lysis system protein LysC [Shewanella sp. SE1]|uniref:Rz1-like lysis system protein LysC n=1 Tax=Shewanella sp. SE1 TaxID=2705014 RepID=UPI003FCFEFC9